jgi:hypothetical protein
VRTNQVDDQLIRERKDAFRSYQALTPPRVLTSDGEVIAGAYRRGDFPAGTLVGLPVSAAGRNDAVYMRMQEPSLMMPAIINSFNFSE